MTVAYVNRIATAVPPHDVHAAFLDFGKSMLGRHAAIFERMAKKSGIDHRYSFLAPGEDRDGPSVDRDRFYVRDNFPSTATRMRYFEAHAPQLAAEAVERLGLGKERESISHILITCCTGLSAPGLDLEIIERCGLPSSAERTIIGFMGCYAAINALKLARHIVRSEPMARVLVINIELCTLHLQESPELEKILSFLLWGDGCAVALVTGERGGFALDEFRALIVPDSRDLITWQVGDQGFDMNLSGHVPAAVQQALRERIHEIVGQTPLSAFDLWAVHPGGRSVLEAVERGLELAPAALATSREVLRSFGNMSSATVMFVLGALMRIARKGSLGLAMSFGPGLVAETMRFQAA